MGRRIGRTEPYPGCGSRDADVFRASEVQHTVQHVSGDGHFGRLPAVRLRPEPVSDDALPSRDVSLDQGTIVVPRGPLPTHATALGNTLQIGIPLCRRSHAYYNFAKLWRCRIDQ